MRLEEIERLCNGNEQILEYIRKLKATLTVANTVMDDSILYKVPVNQTQAYRTYQTLLVRQMQEEYK